MVGWIGLLAVLAAIFGVLGFGGIAGAIAGLAQTLFAGLLIVLAISVAVAALSRR